MPLLKKSSQPRLSERSILGTDAGLVEGLVVNRLAQDVDDGISAGLEQKTKMSEVSQAPSEQLGVAW